MTSNSRKDYITKLLRNIAAMDAKLRELSVMFAAQDVFFESTGAIKAQLRKPGQGPAYYILTDNQNVQCCVLQTTFDRLVEYYCEDV